MPKVSVVIPTYNSSKYLPEALDSVLAQTYKDFEVIVIDDGSTDGTGELLAEYMSRYPEKIKYFRQKNSGASAARNNGIRKSRGRYIVFLDADDVLSASWIAGALRGFTINNAKAVTGRCLSYNPITLSQKVMSLKDEYKNAFNDGDSIEAFFTSGVMLEKEVFNLVGYFDESYRFAEDNDLSFRLKKAGWDIVFIKDILLLKRARESFSRVFKQYFNYGYGKVLLYKGHADYRHSIFRDFFDLFFAVFLLMVRTIARVFKFLVFDECRTKEYLLEHPVGIICLLFNHTGRLNARITFNMWL